MVEEDGREKMVQKNGTERWWRKISEVRGVVYREEGKILELAGSGGQLSRRNNKEQKKTNLVFTWEYLRYSTTDNVFHYLSMYHF